MIDAKRDWLGELHAALVTGVAFGALGGLATVGRAMLADTVDLTIQTAAADEVTGLPSGVRLADAGAVEVTVADPAWAERLCAALQGAPAYLLGMLIILWLWRIVAVARRTDPFSPELPRRLRRLGLATLVLGLVAELLRIAIDAAASTVIYGEFWGLSFRSGFWWLLVGFGLLAVAEVLRRGVELRHELDEVV